MAEAAVAAAIDRLLKKRGAYVINIHNSGHGRNGVADRSVGYRGWPLLIEVKGPGGKADRLQVYELARARRAGIVAFIAESASQVAEVLDTIDALISADIAPWAINVDRLCPPLPKVFR